MKITKIKVGCGNTCGPTYQPIKCYIELEAELNEDGFVPVPWEDELNSLSLKVGSKVYDYCYDQLVKLKGAEEAAKFREEQKDG